MANKDETQVYELGYLILPSIAEENLSEVVAKIKTVVEKAGGKEFNGEAPFKLDLAYTMSKTVGASHYVVNEAYIGWMKFELEPGQALELKMGIDQIEEVLRSLLIKVPRETYFTFAKARELIEEKEREAMEGQSEETVVAPTLEEVGVPTEASGNNL